MEGSLVSFDRCPRCGCKDTVARKFVTEEVRKRAGWGDAFVSLEKVMTPLFNPQNPPIGNATGIVAHYDVCFKCGLRYCTRAEVIVVPISYDMTKLPPGGFKG